MADLQCENQYPKPTKWPATHTTICVLITTLLHPPRWATSNKENSYFQLKINMFFCKSHSSIYFFCIDNKYLPIENNQIINLSMTVMAPPPIPRHGLPLTLGVIVSAKWIKKASLGQQFMGQLWKMLKSVMCQCIWLFSDSLSSLFPKNENCILISAVEFWL